jgi:glutamyl-tRNA synthetase
MPDSGYIVTRFAPSPTGHLHIGGARTAMFCWAFAKRQRDDKGRPGRFMIRIEDTDRARSSEESARGILEDLAWLGIDWDDGPALSFGGRTIGGDARGVGPYFQAQRVGTYDRYIMQLVRAGHAYPAFETPEELEAKRKAAAAAKQTYRYDRAALSIPLPERIARIQAGEKHVVRFRVPDEPVVVTDQVLGEVRYAAGEVDDFVIRKADGFPTYHFAVVIDDELMGVTHILRAQEHLNNTPRHVAMQKALVREDTREPFRTPVYAHMPLIFNMDGTKMSKRDKAKAARAAAKAAIQKDPSLTAARLAASAGAKEAEVAEFLAAKSDSVEVAEALAAYLDVQLPEIEVWDYRRSGYLPEAITNFIGLLGWSPGGDIEKFDMKFLAENFSIDRIGKTNARFDRVKLLSFNQDYIKALSDEEFERRWRAWADQYAPGAFEGLDPRRMSLLAAAMKPRSKTFSDGLKGAKFALTPDDAVELDPKAVEKVLAKGQPPGIAVLKDVRSAIAAVEPFEPGPIQAAIDAWCAAKGVAIGAVAQPVRVAMTGTAVSPPLGETLAVLGKESVLRRIDRCLAAVPG